VSVPPSSVVETRVTSVHILRYPGVT